MFDKNNSKYWWDEFLELQEVYTDDSNTEKSLGSIDNTLTRLLKKKYYGDYIILRNSIIGYYRNNDNLNYSDLISEVVENYTPFNDEFPKDKLLNNLRKLPKEKKFDTQFSIVKNKIKKNIKRKIKLADNLYLSIDDYVENLKNIIEPYKDNEGNKYVKIFSSDGYDIIKDLVKE